MALLRSELVSSVWCTDWDSQRIAASACCEIDNLFRVGVCVVVRRNLVFNACQYAELAFNCYVKLVSVLNNFLSQGNVLLVREVRTVDHNWREAEVNAWFAELEAVAVVEVKHNLWVLPTEFLCVFYSAFCHVAEKSLVGVVASAFWYLKDNRWFSFSSGLDNSLKLLHVIEVECWDSVASLDSLGKHLAGVHETKIFVIDHNSMILISN